MDLDWEMRIKKSSSQVRNMAVPSAIFQLQVEDLPSHINQFPNVAVHHFECSKNTVEVLLDGLIKIKDQLGAVGK